MPSVNNSKAIQATYYTLFQTPKNRSPTIITRKPNGSAVTKNSKMSRTANLGVVVMDELELYDVTSSARGRLMSTVISIIYCIIV